MANLNITIEYMWIMNIWI